jgi:hypothetical protein
MAEAPQTYGEFVVACAPIVRGEVARLRRCGLERLSFDDASQEGFLILLENEHSLDERRDAALARTIVRRRLINRYVEKDHAKRRGGWVVDLHLDMFIEADDDTNDGFGARNLGAISVQPVDVTDRVLLAQLESIEPLPRTSGTTRQAAHQMRARWAKRMRAEVGP